MSFFMGIDLGTSSVKALICDEKGKIYGIGQTEYEIQSPRPGFYEQDPENWWSCTVSAVRQSIAEAGIASELIMGIGFSGQMHGMVYLGEDKKPLGPAIIHLDQRALLERSEMIQKAGGIIREKIMNRPASGMMICSLLWLKNHDPAVYEKIRYVLSPKDYIRFRMTGEICSDYTDASATLAFSAKDKTWCRQLFDQLDLKKDIWPPVTGSCSKAGKLSAGAAELLHLRKETQTAAGSGDCTAAAAGNGIVDEGIVACNIGTSSQLAVVVYKPVTDQEMAMQLWCHSADQAWLYQGGCLNGGSTLNWLRNKVLRTDLSYAQLDLAAGEVDAGSEDLLFLPYLTGERTPYNDPEAKGIYAGLALRHDYRHFVRATMEGVMFNLMECRRYFDELNLPQKVLISSGGAARGITWRQIQADMLDMPVHTTKTKEEACLGAALYAMVATGVYPDLKAACKEVVCFEEMVVEPIRRNVGLYKNRQKAFRELYLTTKPVFDKINA